MVDYNRSENAQREFTVVAEGGFRGLGRRYIDIRCPFCSLTSRAFVWSLCGGGKKCENKKCGALFGSTGTASPVVGQENGPRT